MASKEPGRATTRHSSRVSTSVVAPWSGRPTTIYGLAGEQEDGGHIFAQDLETGQLLWSSEPDWAELASVFGDELAAGAMGCSKIAFADVTGDGEREVIAIHVHNKWYPSVLSVYHRDGRRIGAYYHPGFLRDVVDYDVNRDGRQELLVVGTNNGSAYQGATLIVLDGMNCHGAAFDSLLAPETGACDLEDSALIRLIFPQFKKVYMEKVGTRRLDGSALTIGGRLGSFGITMMVDLWGGGLVIEIDDQLRPLAVSPSDALISSVVAWPDGLGASFLSDEHLEQWLQGQYRYGTLADEESWAAWMAR